MPETFPINAENISFTRVLYHKENTNILMLFTGLIDKFQVAVDVQTNTIIVSPSWSHGTNNLKLSKLKKM